LQLKPKESHKIESEKQIKKKIQRMAKTEGRGRKEETLVPAEDNVIRRKKEENEDNEFKVKNVGWFQRGSSAKSR